MGIAPRLPEIAFARNDPTGLQEVIGEIVFSLKTDEQDEEETHHAATRPPCAEPLTGRPGAAAAPCLLVPGMLATQRDGCKARVSVSGRREPKMFRNHSVAICESVE